MASKEALLAILDGSNQEHLVDDYDILSPTEQATLTDQIQSFTNAQWRHMNSILRDSLHHLNTSNLSAKASDSETTTNALDILPPPPDAVISMPTLLAENPNELQAIRTAGLEVIARCQGAVLVMAGGSGTRLGVNIPKGMFECNKLIGKRSLFAFHCQRIRKAELMAANHAGASVPAGAGSGTIPLVVMTSDQNDADTQFYFRENDFFGLMPDQVFFSRQGSLPCYDESTGRVLLEARGKMCLAPSGNAGVYECLGKTPTAPPASKNMLELLRARGVRYVQIGSVDNILARYGDPYFFGVAASRQAEVVIKTVPKLSAEERVGVVALVNGEWSVVEYTEIGAARSAERDPATGELALNCGNIASHCCSVDFLALAAKYMQTNTVYHAARKTILTTNGPAPAIKLEAFIFDVFRYAKDVPSRVERAKREPLASAFRILQVDRSREFAPIKNADGAAVDTPTTAALLLLELHTKWVVAAIAAAPQTCEGTSQDTSLQYTAEQRAAALQRLQDGVCRWEISPLISYEGEDLTEYVGYLIRCSANGSGVMVLDEITVNRENLLQRDGEERK